VSKRCTKSSQELRLEAVALHKHHPDWSFRAIAKKMHCSHCFVSRWHIPMAAKLSERFSACYIAAQVEQDSGAKFSTSTVKRILRKEGLTHLSPKVVPLLTAQHMLDRVQFAKKALRRELVPWFRVPTVDSNFPLYAQGKPAGRWCTPATRGTEPRKGLLCMCTWEAARRAPPNSCL